MPRSATFADQAVPEAVLSDHWRCPQKSQHVLKHMSHFHSSQARASGGEDSGFKHLAEASCWICDGEVR